LESRKFPPFLESRTEDTDVRACQEVKFGAEEIPTFGADEETGTRGTKPSPPPPAATGHRIPARNWRDREREGEEKRPHPHVDNQVFPWATEDDGEETMKRAIKKR
jgi:hypothetical protein